MKTTLKQVLLNLPLLFSQQAASLFAKTRVCYHTLKVHIVASLQHNENGVATKRESRFQDKCVYRSPFSLTFVMA